jgi:hypothetical protein
MERFEDEADKVFAISEYLVKILQGNIFPPRAIEALVGALIIVFRTSNNRTGIEETAENHTAADYRNG